MTTITFSAHGRRYELTDAHPASAHGQPVLVADDGAVYGAWDRVSYPVDPASPAAAATWAARAIAGLLAKGTELSEAYWRRLDPRSADGSYVTEDDPTMLDLVRRFESLPAGRND